MMDTRTEHGGLLWARSIALGCLLCLAVSQSAHAGAAFDCEGITPASGAELRAELVTDQLSSPLDISTPPGDTQRLFVVERAGRIRIINLADDSLRTTPFLDIREASGGPVLSGGELGLLGLAFHPDYASNGYFFVNYTRRPGSVCSSRPPPGCTNQRVAETVVARFSVSAGDANVADAASQKVLLSFCQPYSNHNGGQVAFGPLDGYLYISTGDGGDGDDPCSSGQRPESFLGKILRLDVDTGDPYAIPPSNPFASTSDEILDEIWALGLRNPWRVAFDPSNGDLYIADVGQGAWEELDYQPGASTGGLNYEWDVREGNHPHTANPSTSYGPGTRQGAILEYPHNDPNSTFDGCSITGGAVYRGCSMPDLHGTYFFADYCGHWVRSVRIVDGQVTELRDRTAELNLGAAPDALDDIVAFGTDARGEVYVCDFGTKLFRIVSANPAPPLPRTFSRGSTNGDELLDLADAVFMLGYLFRGSPASVDCADALDSNDDGSVDIADAVFLILHLFGGGSAPAAPFPGCGEDASPDDLPCPVSTCAAGP